MNEIYEATARRPLFPSAMPAPARILRLLLNACAQRRYLTPQKVSRLCWDELLPLLDAAVQGRGGVGSFYQPDERRIYLTQMLSAEHRRVQRCLQVAKKANAEMEKLRHPSHI